jgi:hypothetical protein
MNEEVFIDHKAIKPEVDMTDDGYKFGKTQCKSPDTEMKKGLEVQAECTHNGAERADASFKDGGCPICLKKIIDRQAEQIKVKDNAIGYAMSCSVSSTEGSKLTVTVLNILEQALKGIEKENV